MKPVKNADTGLYEVEIDDIKFEFQKMGAEEGLDLLLEVSKLVGKPMGMAIAAFVGNKEEREAGASALDREIDGKMLGTAMEALTQGFADGSAKKLIKKLSSEKVLANGAKIAFNTFYEDRFDLMFKVVWAALEVQHGNFIAGLLGFVKSSPLKGMATTLVNRT